MKQRAVGEETEGASAPKSDKRQPAAVASAVVAASVGEIALVYSRSAALKHYALADIEWLILPAVLNGQFHIAQAANEESGPPTPVAVATWAFVSPEVDQKLSSELLRRVRLRPDEWKCGEIGWIIDWAGDPRGVAATIAWLRAGPFRDKDAKVIVRDLTGRARVARLADLAAASADETPAR